MKAISGLEPVAAGRILFEGQDITRLPGHRRVALGIAQSPEGRQVFADQSVRDNLVLGAYHRSASHAEIEADIEARFQAFPGCASASTRPRARCPAASSRCWPSPAR